MTRSYNFCAGPAALPEAVLETARDDMLDWHVDVAEPKSSVVAPVQRAKGFFDRDAF